MRWWGWWRQPDRNRRDVGTDAAALALASSREQLLEARRRRPEAHRVYQELRQLRERDHFAELIQGQFGERR